MSSDERVVLDGQRRVLELIAEGRALREVLATLCLCVEAGIEGTRCSVLLLERDGLRVRHGAGPSLPVGYLNAIDGAPIGPVAGSCGTAMYRREPVVVEDVSSHPLWAPFRDLALSFGLGACASVPILAGQSRDVLGSFAIYHAEPGPFSERELKLLHSFTDLAAVAIVNDQRERALHESEAQRSRTEAFSLVMVAETSLEGVWLKVPPTLCALLGYSEAELLGTDVADRTHPDDLEHEAACLRQLAHGEKRSCDLEKRFLKKGGGEVWTYVNMSVLCDDQGTPLSLLSFMRDLSDKKRAEEMLRRTQKAEGLAVLAGGIAHDFNNLLAAMGANATLLGKYVSGQPEARDLVRNLEGLVKQAASFTQQLLAYTGKAHVEVRTHDLNELVDNVVHLISVSVSKNITVRFEHGADLPRIEADAAQVQQVALNLITNASEAIGQGPGTITIRTDRVMLDLDELAARFVGQALRSGPYVLLEVRDTGSGMSAETRSRIFDPFFTTKFSGRGLGLAAVRGILEAHHAGFELESTPGHGTCFRLYFPASVAAAEPVGSTPAPPEPSHEAMHTILLVDDEEGVRDAMGKLLECLGHTVYTASDGRDALEKLEELAARLSVVIMDVTMPGLDGVEVARRMAKRWPGLPVVLTSGYAEASMPDELGSVSFLQKPYSLDEIERALVAAAKKRPRLVAGALR